MDRRLISLMPSCCFLSLDYYSSFCHNTMYRNCICSLNNRTFFFSQVGVTNPIFRPSILKLGIASFSSFSLSWAAFTWLTDSSCPAGSVRFISVLKSSVQNDSVWNSNLTHWPLFIPITIMPSNTPSSLLISNKTKDDSK